MPKSVDLCYALISRDHVVLCDHSLAEGNFVVTSQEVLENVLRRKGVDNKFSYDHGEYTYHAYLSDGFVYVCACNSMFDRNVAFNCLFDLEHQLASAGLKERARSAGPYALRTCFSPTIASVLTKYSSSDRLGILECKVDKVSGVMKQNIDKVMQRGEVLDHLTERSDLLAEQATDFRQSSTKLSRKLYFKNVKLWVIIITILVIVLVSIVIIILSILGAEGKL